MNIDTVYYINVTFLCDNACSFCFSHNTYNNSICNIKMSDIDRIIIPQGINTHNRAVFNGGEPALHPQLPQIINYFHTRGVETVLYSNGRRFEDLSYAIRVVSSGLNRITVPLHGPPNVHNSLTGNTASFGESVNGINNLLIIKNKFAPNLKLELKFILTNQLLSSAISLEKIAFNYLNNPMEVDCVVISGAVKTQIAVENKFDIPLPEETAHFVSNELDCQCTKWLQNRSLKLINVPLCKLDAKIRNMVLSKFSQQKCVGFNKFNYYDGKNPKGKILRYSALPEFYPECTTCTYAQKCTSIERSYIVVNRDHKGIWYCSPE